MADITILDVGHGNCAVVRDDEHLLVIDAPLRDTELKALLLERDVREIDAVLISHADADHIGGVLTLLTDPDIAVRHLYLNSESQRGSKIWEDLRYAVADAQRRQDGLRVHIELTTANTDNFDLPSLTLEVIAPTPQLAMAGAGGNSPAGRPLSANSMSAVIRIRDDRSAGVLFMGDLDQVGLDEVLSEATDLRAEILVFPHHGGRPSSAAPRPFAEQVCAAVQPEMVVFSLGRGEHATPRPEIVAGVRSSSPQAHIACTQLSERCAAALPRIEQPYLSGAPARGKRFGACCAGTLDLIFSDSGLLRPQQPGHVAYVDQLPTPECRRHG